MKVAREDRERKKENEETGVDMTNYNKYSEMHSNSYPKRSFTKYGVIINS